MDSEMKYSHTDTITHHEAALSCSITHWYTAIAPMQKFLPEDNLEVQPSVWLPHPLQDFMMPPIGCKYVTFFLIPLAAVGPSPL